MIRLRENGIYELIQTKRFTKVLYLNNDAYAWVDFDDIGELLVASPKHHSVGAILSKGRYRIYDVENEPDLVDQRHMELEVGEHQWQGYLLLTGLPNVHKIRARIIPTSEVITTDSLLTDREQPVLLSTGQE